MKSFSPLFIKKILKLSIKSVACPYLGFLLSISHYAFGQAENFFHIGSIKNYKVSSDLCKNSKGELFFRLREWSTGSRAKLQLYSLAVDTNTLETSIFPSQQLNCQKDPNSQASFETSLYYKTLKWSSEKPFPINNDGITHSISRTTKTSLLTVDLCPSFKPLDRDFFVKLNQRMHPFPLAISISGFWILKHKEDLEWLVEQNKNQSLNITWVNHSNSHPYIKELPPENNFLLLPQINFENEVLKTEIKLIENNLIPSVFFRFPGLISNEKLVTELSKKYGLITLGADAWLANGVKPDVNGGSIILVHGNGNEPLGLKLFWKFALTFEPIERFFQYSFNR